MCGATCHKKGKTLTHRVSPPLSTNPAESIHPYSNSLPSQLRVAELWAFQEDTSAESLRGKGMETSWKPEIFSLHFVFFFPHLKLIWTFDMENYAFSSRPPQKCVSKLSFLSISAWLEVDQVGILRIEVNIGSKYLFNFQIGSRWEQLK